MYNSTASELDDVLLLKKALFLNDDTEWDDEDFDEDEEFEDEEDEFEFEDDDEEDD